MKTKIFKYLKEILIFFIVLAVALNAISYYRSLDLNDSKLDIKSFKLLDGTTYDIAKNKPIILHFWATWCAVCKLEASTIQKISQDYELISIAVKSGSREDIKKYMKENKVNFKVVNDENGFLSNKFNVKAFPTTFVYGKDKELKFSEVGYTTRVGFYSKMAFVK